jgi:PTH2 family peptidyl-tRNA hydrolase
METKQVIVIRRDLKMRRGKEGAQCGHAALKWLTNRLQVLFEGEAVMSPLPPDLSATEREWLQGMQTKIVLAVADEQGLRDLFEAALAAGVNNLHVVVDAGKTEFGGVPTATCLAIGPDLAEKIDPITRHLKLY